MDTITNYTAQQIVEAVHDVSNCPINIFPLQASSLPLQMLIASAAFMKSAIMHASWEKRWKYRKTICTKVRRRHQYSVSISWQYDRCHWHYGRTGGCFGNTVT